AVGPDRARRPPVGAVHPGPGRQRRHPRGGEVAGVLRAARNPEDPRGSGAPHLRTPLTGRPTLSGHRGSRLVLGTGLPAGARGEPGEVRQAPVAAGPVGTSRDLRDEPATAGAQIGPSPTGPTARTCATRTGTFRSGRPPRS